MWVIMSAKEEQWIYTVGFFTPKGDWVPWRDFYNDKHNAERFIHWLNGGNSLEAFKEVD